MNELTAQLHKLHTTPLGAERVRRNLQIEAEDVAAWCRERILDPDTVVERVGKTGTRRRPPPNYRQRPQLYHHHRPQNQRVTAPVGPVWQRFQELHLQNSDRKATI